MKISYEVIELSPPPEAKVLPPWTMARAVNEAGAAAGYADMKAGPAASVEIEPATWDEAGGPEVPQPLPLSGGAEALNDQGDVVGWFRSNAPPRQAAFIYHPGEQLEDLGPVLGGNVNLATDINNAGVVVGGVKPDDPPAVAQPFVYDRNDGSVTAIKPPPGHGISYAIAVNEAEHVIGLSEGPEPGPVHSHLFIYREGATDDLGAGLVFAPGGLFPCNLNNSDVITGSRVTQQTQIASAFRLDANAAAPSYEDLGQELPAGFAGSFGIGINEDEVIVGAALDETNTLHAMVHFPTGSEAGWHDLNHLLINGHGWDLQVATAVSDSGYIVGDGLHRGERRSFLLKPWNLATDKIAQVVWVLIMIIGGGTVDAPGSVGITPGGHPVPIDPQEFKRFWNTLSPSEKDLYLGQAIRSLGSLVADDEQREQVGLVGTAVIKEAARKTFGEGR
jgi:probable HAF family extracellular repeat protein